MAAYQNHRKLIVWQKAISLVRQIYAVTQTFPPFELYGLTSQIQRAAVSIPSNIAEGCGRDSENEFTRFLKIASGSAYELDTQIEIAFLNGYINQEKYYELITLNKEVVKMLFSLRKSQNTK